MISFMCLQLQEHQSEGRGLWAWGLGLEGPETLHDGHQPARPGGSHITACERNCWGRGFKALESHLWM